MSRYSSIPFTRYTEDSKQGYVITKYPEIPAEFSDIYVYTTRGDRYDTLALSYYQNPSLWWVIASANALPGDSLVVEPGTQLRIPVDLIGAINTYKLVNAIR